MLYGVSLHITFKEYEDADKSSKPATMTRPNIPILVIYFL